MLKRLPTIAALVILVIVIAAGTAAAAKVTVVVTGGPLDIQLPFSDQSLNGVTLDGTNQTTTGTLGETRIRDARGTGTGWYVTVSATDFEEESDPGKTIPAGGFRVPVAPTVTVLSGFDGGIVADSGPLAAPGLTLLVSPNPNGRGRFSVTPDLELDVPAETYIGTYASTITETITSY